MLAAVEQTGSLDQRVRHVGDATSLRDSQNTGRYLAGGDHTLALWASEPPSGLEPRLAWCSALSSV